jgi:hypothetical protein
VANRLVRRAIRRLVGSMGEERGIASLRAPRALARTQELRARIKAAFDRAGIEVPGQQ